MPVQQAFQEQPSFPIEPNRQELLSPRPESRADPPSALVHLPAAAMTREIWFRPAYLAKAQTSGPACVAKNDNFYQLGETVSTSLHAILGEVTTLTRSSRGVEELPL